MLVLIATILLLLIHSAQSGLIAKAKVHADSSYDHMGYLWFMQNNASAPVTIKGKLWKLQPNTVHVSFQKDL
jgi:hypothetical protein